MITELSASELRELMPNLESGMVPKMEACLRAVEGGLTRATVVDGRVPHALLLDFHQRRHRHDGHKTDWFAGQPGVPRDEGIPPHGTGMVTLACAYEQGGRPLGPPPRAQGQRGVRS